MKKRTYFLLSLTAILITVLTGCHSNGASKSNNSANIKIAAMSTTESSIMANMISELIHHELGYNTTLISNLGSANVGHQALLRKDADIAATRYTGTDLTGTLNLPAEKDPSKAAKIVKKEFTKRYDQTWFPTYGFADTYAFMVTEKFAQENQLKSVSDLKKLSATARTGVDSTWMNRKGDGYKDFSRAYKFSFKKIYPMQIGLVYDAVENNKMQVVLGYSTDGRIQSYKLKILKDNKHFFPPYDTSMVVNNSILRKYPKLKKLLHRLDGKISLKTMQKLNYKVDDQLLEPSLVAQQFLKEHHYFRGGDKQ
ncbi:osmoprotectant ABC transporter substrate-binding protein [Streptococcus macacae]|uniref:Glycine betaine/carnitine/choline-binding protein n=1 Tax=Streptococcus macacae NCTC 11558 TaxID=764298 RepID=G5JX24_9STRE|nr:osmoprotectant ABC transporter substrate-binding protein [Streptococcus macacae]EHJ51549.1 glycine betaine/carnitine/choline-binding protein [Streptococcus macacae NCTC 11558]SUN79503.1 ABC transporter [Streptococcus macacae NCTC 11558]